MMIESYAPLWEGEMEEGFDLEGRFYEYVIAYSDLISCK